MKQYQRFVSRLFLPLLLVTLNSATAQRRCDVHVVRAETNTWLHKNFMSFAYERSIGPSSLTVAFGGGWMGKSEHYLAPDKVGSLPDREDINNSQTIFPAVPRVNQERPYLQRVKTIYRGGLMRFGYSYYFNGSRCANRMTGLYTGLDLLLIQTFENQTLTYHYIKANTSYEVSGENKFWTGGAALFVGYQKRFLNDLLVTNVRLQHPFYMPFSEEINISSPFAGNRWEVNVGIGLRIKT